MNIHITLMGGQRLPVYKGILESRPDMVYIIHTAETTENVKTVAELVDMPVEKVAVEATDYPAIRERTGALFSEGNTYSVNISGGTKIMSLALYQEAVKIPGATIFYLDQNDLILDLKTLGTSLCKREVNIETLFKLAGNPLKSCKKLSDYSAAEMLMPEKIRQLIKFAPREFYALLEMARKNKEKTDFAIPSGSGYRMLSPRRLEIIVKNRYGQRQEIFEANDPKKMVRDTEWFELETALLLSNWQHTKEILIGGVVSYSSGNAKNEIDIIVNTGSKVLFLECKTQVTDIKDIDKFSNVVRNNGGLAARGILVTDDSLKKQVMEKCNDNRIIHINRKEVNTGQKLFDKLENILFKNNPV